MIFILFENRFARPHGCTQSANLDAVLRKNNVSVERANKDDIILELLDCSSSSSDE